MDKSSMKPIFLVVLLIFVAGETSNIGAEGSRLNQYLVPCFGCNDPCLCVFQNCHCGVNLPLTSQPHQNPMMVPMDPPVPL
ncbi:hypothetical protein LINGRAHAP2_LOCUS9603 [Linum grandiflorum]